MGSVTVVGGTRGGREPKDSGCVEIGMHGVLRVFAQFPELTVSFQAMHHPLSCQNHLLPGPGCPSSARRAAAKVSGSSRQNHSVTTTGRHTSSLTRDQKPLLT